MQTIPIKLDITTNEETLDTEENRFVKYAFNSFYSVLKDMEKVLLNKSSISLSDKRLLYEFSELQKNLSSILSHPLFREVSEPRLLNLGSPVLQRKPGYRELLKAWIRFNAAMRLIWKGGDDVYGGGKRDVANLYEYWVFFELLYLVKNVFDVESKGLEDLIKQTSDGFGLQLKQGQSSR